MSLDASEALAESPRESLADAIVAKLCCVTRARTLEHAVEIGQIVVQGVAEQSCVGEASGEAHPIYKQIASHSQLPFSPKRLWMCVKIYELVQAFPGLQRASHLGVAHLRAVLTLPPHVQERLLTSAEKELWTSDRLAERAAAFRHKPSSRGRPPTKLFFERVQRIEQLAEELHESLAPRLQSRLTEASAAVARESLRRASRALQSVEREMQYGVHSQLASRNGEPPAGGIFVSHDD